MPKSHRWIYAASTHLECVCDLIHMQLILQQFHTCHASPNIKVISVESQYCWSDWIENIERRTKCLSKNVLEMSWRRLKFYIVLHHPTLSPYHFLWPSNPFPHGNCSAVEEWQSNLNSVFKMLPPRLTDSLNCMRWILCNVSPRCSFLIGLTLQALDQMFSTCGL